MSSTKIINKTQKTKNGNIKSIKIMQWNSGSCWAERTIDKVENIIMEYNPHIIFVSEMNADAATNPQLLNIRGFNVETDSMPDSGHII